MEVARILRTERKPLLLCGIAGAYDRNLQKGDVVAVTEERYAHISTGYIDSYHATIEIDDLPTAISNTVSHCGMEAEGAQIENMEGATLFAMSTAMGFRAVQIRAISNRVGEGFERWHIEQALEALAESLSEII